MAMHVLLSDGPEEQSCAVCGGKKCKEENSLTYDCPARPLTKDERVKIHKQELDFQRDKWKTYMHVGNPPQDQQPHH